MEMEIVRKSKRIISLLGISLALFIQTAAAQQVVVDGMGTDKESALRDASRNAVEQVVGTMIDSKTLVNNAVVALDTIYTKSQGFVTNQEILSQDERDGMVHVRARIDVNTNPDSQLMSNLNMIMNLNDPRIAVIMLRQNSQGRVTGHDTIAEAALNNRLLSLGFAHVIDANVVANLENAQLLNQIYNGSTGITSLGQSLGADYIVLGRTQVQAQTISLPDGKGGYEPTLLKTGNATLSAKIIKFDTGDIVGTFTTTAKGVENSNEMAEQKAVQQVSEEAAKQLEEKFRHFSAVAESSVQVEVYTNDYGAVQQFVEDLKALPVVQNVYLREHQNGKAILAVETTEKPNTLIQMLRGKTKLGLFVASVTVNAVKLSVSR